MIIFTRTYASLSTYKNCKHVLLDVNRRANKTNIKISDLSSAAAAATRNNF